MHLGPIFGALFRFLDEHLGWLPQFVIGGFRRLCSASGTSSRKGGYIHLGQYTSKGAKLDLVLF